MSEPWGDPRGECVLCREPAVEDVDAVNVDGDLMHDECLAMENDPYEMSFSMAFIEQLGERYTARIEARRR